MEEGIILGAGNPLLDIIAHVDKEFLVRWRLKENYSMPCTDDMIEIFNEIETLNPKHIPGGTVQNTAMVFQWIIKKKNSFTVLGTVGDDESGRELKERMMSSGINAQYRITADAPTGKCAVLINGHHRSMCTLLGASKFFPANTFDDPVVSKWIGKARYFYFSCQFFNAAGDFLFRVAEYCKQSRKFFCLNLGSPLSQARYALEIERLFPFVDVVFGNGEEVAAFGEAQKTPGSIEEIALAMANKEKVNDRERIVVVTQASEPVIVANQGSISEYEVPGVKKDEVVGTDGAGDAFVGGFLSQFVQGRPIDTCVKCGIYAASEMIKRPGCSPPEECRWE